MAKWRCFCNDIFKLSGVYTARLLYNVLSGLNFRKFVNKNIANIAPMGRNIKGGAY